MTLAILPLVADATSFADRLRVFLFDIGLPPDLTVVGLVAAGIVFVLLDVVRSLWRRALRGRRGEHAR